MTAEHDQPYTWQRDLFALVALGEGPPGGMAVCVEHKGAHQWYLTGCWALPPQQPVTQRTALAAQRPAVPVVRVELDADLLYAVVEDAMTAAIRRARAEQPRARR